MLTRNSALQRWGERIAIIAVSLAIIHFVARDWPSIGGSLSVVQWPYIGIAVLFFIGYFAARALAWWFTLRSLRAPIPIVNAGTMWFLSELHRYVPGNVWSIVGRFYLAEKENIPRHTTLVGLLLEGIMLVGSAGLLSLLWVYLSPIHFSEVYRWLGLLIIPAGILLIAPSIIEKVINRILKKRKHAPVQIHLRFLSLVGLLGLFLVAWLCYGIASYWVLRAFTNPLSAPTVWLITGFIVAWLVGYLSFITPMGLGVREAVVIFFLSPFLPAGLAGVVAIASRLVLVAAELLCASAITTKRSVTLWHQKRKAVYPWIRSHWTEIILALLIMGFISYFTSYTFLRHARFMSSRFDLGIMDQVVWNTAHGRFLQLTQPDGMATISRFAIHADAFLALLAPLYWVVASPYVLLLVQTIVVALGALPLYWLGQEVLRSKPLALIIAAGYLLFPPLERAVIFDFHSVTLASSFLLFAFYFLYKKRYGWFAVAALLTLTTKETMTFLVVMLGLYAIVAQKNWRVGLATIGASCLWFYLLLWHLMPAARSDGSAHFALNYYSDLGDSPNRILESIFTHPVRWISTVVSPEQSRYLLYFLVPTGFLVLLSPIILMTLPELAINMLSSNWAMHTIFFQYTSAITPFVFIALVFGLARAQQIAVTYLPTRIKRFPSELFLAFYLLLMMCIGMWLWSPLPEMPLADTAAFHANLPAAAYLHKLALTIPSDAKVSATTNMAPHFSERENIFPFPLGVGEAEYVITQRGGLSDIVPASDIDAAIENVRLDARYRLLYQKENVAIFQKTANQPKHFPNE